MKTLGVDYGERHVGLAIAEEGLAVAVGELEHVTDDELCSGLKRFVEERRIERVVVGLPIGMNGKPTEQTNRTQAFCTRLAAALAVPVETQDERLTSVQGGSHAGAAVILLQTYLDRTA